MKQVTKQYVIKGQMSGSEKGKNGWASVVRKNFIEKDRLEY